MPFHTQMVSFLRKKQTNKQININNTEAQSGNSPDKCRNFGFQCCSPLTFMNMNTHKKTRMIIALDRQSPG